TPEMVMKLYMNKLTPYEHHEIFNYQQIYFIGANAKKRPGIIGRPNNNEYDNEQGSYIHVPHDHVAYRYEVLRVIGKGSFGQVVKAYDHKTHEHVALKMVRNEKRFHRQAHEEIRILRKLREQDKDNTMNIIHMFDSFTFRCHMCITFELLSINLYELIKKNNFKGFSLQLVRKFSHSLLLCLDALYKNKIIHCDMKPENVLLKQQGRSGIKVNSHVNNPIFIDIARFYYFLNKYIWHPWLRRRLPRPPGDKNDTLPAVTSAQPATTGGGPTLRTSASGSRSSSKTNSLQSSNNTSDDISTSKTTGQTRGNRLVEDMVSAYAGYSYNTTQLHSIWGTTGGLSSGHQSLNSISGTGGGGGGGGRSSSSKTNSLQGGNNTSDDISANKTTGQQRGNRLVEDVVSAYAGYSSAYGASQLHGSTWGTTGGLSSGHQSLNSVSSRSSSKTNNQLQSGNNASSGDLSTSKTERQQQRERTSELPVTIFDPYPLGSYGCLSESQLHSSHRSNQSSSHQSLNSVDGATTGKSQRARQTHQTQQQQQHNNNGASHDSYGSHGSSSSSSRLVLSFQPGIQEILEELRR
ncbi:Putative dual specificity tyrosine-phosphorylation-regulated kinase 3 like protein, partial [Trachymyrmex cornetzi]